MSTTNTTGLKESSKIKCSSKKDELIAFVANSPYIQKEEQPDICRQFGFEYVPGIFRKEYRKRIKQFLKERTTTAATVCKHTLIPHKYITQVKSGLEKADELVVVKIDRCETTKSPKVQYLSTDPAIVKAVNSKNNK
jgi:hypothetical protein